MSLLFTKKKYKAKEWKSLSIPRIYYEKLNYHLQKNESS